MNVDDTLWAHSLDSLMASTTSAVRPLSRRGLLLADTPLYLRTKLEKSTSASTLHRNADSGNGGGA